LATGSGLLPFQLFPSRGEILKLICSNNKNENQNPSQPTSVVTGAAGSSRLASDGPAAVARHKVIGIDNFVTGSVDNIAHLGGNRDFKFIEQDVTEFLFLDAPVNYVWHFASPASPIDYLDCRFKL